MEITADHLLYPTDDGTPGFSRESNVAKRRARIIRKRTFHTASRQPTKILTDELIHVFRKCHMPNWDGYGAAAVNADTLQAALLITKFAPDFSVIPEVLADPDGDIAFEWNKGENSLTIAINASREIAFAGFFEDDAHIRGTERLNDKFPETISCLIARVFGN